MVNYILAPLAIEDLHHIWDRTVDMWGEVQADRYINDLHERCQWLSEQPRIGKERNDLLPGLRCFPEGAHIVYYCIAANDQIEILRFVHQKQDISRVF